MYCYQTETVATITTEHGALLHEQLFAGTGQGIGGLPEQGGRSIYVRVCPCVWFCGHCGWWANCFAKEKNGKKRGVVRRGRVECCEQASVCECARSNVCATVFACCPPTLYPFGLVAVAVLADTMFELVRCSRCFST